MNNVSYYKLVKENSTFYIQLLDSERKVIKDYENLEKNELNDYIRYSKDDNFFINWGEESNEYVKLDDELVELLLESKKFVDKNFKEISVEEISKIFLIVKEDIDNRDNVVTSLEISDNNLEVDVVSNHFLCSDRTFFRTDIIENSFYEMKDLITSLDKYEVEGFLTLVIKNYKNIELRYEDYKTISGNIKEPVPQIIIEKISLDNSLYMRINSIISTMDFDFFQKYDLQKVITINEIDKKIYISKINMKTLESNITEIIKILTKLQKKYGEKANYYLDNDGFLVLNEELAKNFVKDELLQLTSKYNIIGTDKLKKYNIKAVRPKITGKFSYGLDYFEGDIEIDIDGEKFTIQQLLNSYKKDTYITLSDGTNALINKKYIEKLERIFKNEKGNKVKISFFDMPIIDEIIDSKINYKKLQPRKDFFEGINEIEKTERKTSKLKAELRDYQKYGYKWLKYLTDHNLGACLADDMGLGKTLQAIAILVDLHSKRNKKSLIIMPKSLIYNWENEIIKFAPSLKTKIYYGTNRDIGIFEKAHTIITTYGTIRNDIERIKDMDFDLVILDESQNIKNITSQTTKAIMALNSKNRIALSGTPIENNLLELYSLFRFLNPTMFGTVQEFNESYIIPIQKYDDKDAIEELKRKIYPFILRRIKKEVLKDLPDKIEKVVYVDMSVEHKKLYEERRLFYYNALNQSMNEKGIEKSKFFILQALNELRHITSSPEIKNKKIVSSKKEILIENIIEAIENDHKVLVFVNYISSIDSICNSLKKHSIKFLKMTGETKDRQTLVDKFQTDSRYKVFVMTLKTGGVGLNLTSADTIFIYDPWWNKTVENQAVDRAYRMGQDKTVFSYKLILKNSIEEKILKLQEMKSKLLDDLISEDNLSTKSLTKNDIEFILGS